MRLKTKFTGMVAILVIVIVAVSSFLLIRFSQLRQIQEYQNALYKNRYEYQAILSFSDKINSRGVNTDTFLSEWHTIIETLDASFSALKNNRARVYMSADMNEQIDGIVNSWDSMAPRIEILTQHYSAIAALPLSLLMKNSIANNGFSKTLERYRDYEDVSVLELELHAVMTEIVTITYVHESFDTLFNSVSTALEEYVVTASRRFNILAVTILIISAAGVYLIVHTITSKLLNRIKALHKMSSSLAQKDLTVKTESAIKDEVGDLTTDLNKAIAILNNFFTVVKHSADTVRNAGQNINGSAEDTASATHEISANIESLKKEFDLLNTAVMHSMAALQQMSDISETLINDNTRQSALINGSNSAISDIASTVDIISNQAEQKTASAEEIRQLLADGDEKMTAAGNLLADITSQLDEISEVITIINAIAEQTNILSMNAAIESAHAGESGKGFGVVAEEIRMLAESTGENAKRISESIYSIVNNVREANETNNLASEAFTRVSEQAKDMILSLRDITVGIRSVDEKARQISEKTRDIAVSAEKINTSCAELNTQQQLVTSEMNSMNNIFSESLVGVNEIKTGTEDIVTRMLEVSSMSSDSCNKMIELETSLDEFKTE